MIGSYKDLVLKYKEAIFYCIFGCLTTIVNIVVYWLMAHIVGVKTVPSSVVAWIAAVMFAYLTNRNWVFSSRASTKQAIAREITTFYFFRLATGIIDWLFMYVTVDVLRWSDVWMKMVANVIVIILNYVASKLVVFRSSYKITEK